jgi:hypothetical protein
MPSATHQSRVPRTGASSTRHWEVVTCVDVLCPSRRTISHATLALADRCRPTRCAIRSQSVCRCRRCRMRFLPDSLTVTSIPVSTLTPGSRLRRHMADCRAASAQLHLPLAVRPRAFFYSGRLIRSTAYPEFKATSPLSALSVRVRKCPLDVRRMSACVRPSGIPHSGKRGNRRQRPMCPANPGTIGTSRPPHASPNSFSGKNGNRVDQPTTLQAIISHCRGSLPVRWSQDSPPHLRREPASPSSLLTVPWDFLSQACSPAPPRPPFPSCENRVL